MAEQSAQEIIDSLVGQLQKSNSEKIGMQVKIDGLTKQVNDLQPKAEDEKADNKINEK
jgi:uncharacterized coiled-coil protein SlyX